MEYISIEQRQIPTNGSSRRNIKIIDIDLKALHLVKKPVKFRYLNCLLYYLDPATPAHGEELEISNGWLTPQDSNTRTVANYVATNIQGAIGGVTTWNHSEDIMFFNKFYPWIGEVNACNNFRISIEAPDINITTVAVDEVVTKILLGYDV